VLSSSTTFVLPSFQLELSLSRDANLTHSSLYFSFFLLQWITSVNNGVWITVALIVVIGINLCGARGYGEAEFFFSMIKVLTIVTLIVSSPFRFSGRSEGRRGNWGRWEVDAWRPLGWEEARADLSIRPLPQFLGIAINCGAGPSNTGYKGFTYWKNPGPLVQYAGISGSLGQFLGFWSVLTREFGLPFLSSEIRMQS